MAGYQPMKVTGMATGLVQGREEFILPNDAYPTLQNAYVWRERILRKKGYELLGRLQRLVTSIPGNTNIAGNFSANLRALLGLEATATLAPGAFSASVGANLYTEPTPPDGTLLVNGVPAPPGSFINWATTDLGLVTGIGLAPVTVNVQYYPGLPVMGLRTRELANSTNDQMLAFDQKYCYYFDELTDRFQEFIPGTTWNANGGLTSAVDFFWSTNYWVSSVPIFSTTDRKLFWVTNDTGQFGANMDSIRVTDGATWINFEPPNYGQIDATNFVTNCLAILPFRGRLLMFNTWEGPTKASSQSYSNRIRWSTIGNPFIAYAAGPPATGSWRDDIRGQGGFLDIPTSEDITAVGFVRDNLVIYCERSTWQLRYTGRSIAPFQIERVNSELGAENLFSAVQFDTSLIGIGDKGIVECDSYKSERIDVKIPDFVFQFRNDNNGLYRVHGIRDFINRLAFWTVPTAYDAFDSNNIFPNKRLVYNYENDSWALFNDSLTCVGNYQPQSSRTWLNTPVKWIECDFPWINDQSEGVPAIVGGNQQGFVEYLDELTTNDVSLYISEVNGNADSEIVLTCPNHNLQTGFVIEVSGIPVATSYDSLNGGIFGITVIDSNSFQIFTYNATSGQFDTPVAFSAGTYVGGGLIAIRENFSIRSKKFSFLDEGQNIQLGYIDILLAATESSNPGAISLNVYLDYNDSSASNTLPDNQLNTLGPPTADTFFNSTIPTVSSTLNQVGGSKFWHRVYCPTRGNFLTLEYTLSNAQMAGVEQQQNVQIDAQILWLRKAGRMTPL